MKDTKFFEIPKGYSNHSALDLRCRGRPEAPPFGDSWTPLMPQRRSWATAWVPWATHLRPKESKTDPKSTQGDPAEALAKPSGPPRWPRWCTALQKPSRKVVSSSPFCVPVPIVKTMLPCTREHGFEGWGHCNFTHFLDIVSRPAQGPFLSIPNPPSRGRETLQGRRVHHGRIGEVRRLCIQDFSYIEMYAPIDPTRINT